MSKVYQAFLDSMELINEDLEYLGGSYQCYDCQRSSDDIVNFVQITTEDLICKFCYLQEMGE